MFIELMQDADKNEILSYMLPYEKFSVTLYSEILHGGKSIYVLRGNFGEIHGIFSWWQGSSIHHCLPEVYGKNRPAPHGGLRPDRNHFAAGKLQGRRAGGGFHGPPLSFI